MSGAYHVALMRPEGFVHAEGLREVAQTLQYGLQRLGQRVSSSCNQVALDATNIVLGAHHLQAADMEVLPAGTILYNFEQICERSKGSRPEYLEALRSHPTWDYSRRNIEALERLHPGGDHRHVPLGYTPEMTRIEAAPRQDIDVLFYGSINERRKQVLQDLQREGVAVHRVFGVYGAERDGLIARSKLVLNLHFYPTNIFEVVRVSYLLANRKAVVSECSDTTEIEPDLRDAVAASEYDELVPTCLALLRDDDRRHEQEQRGFSKMSARDEAAVLERVLGVPA